MKYIYKAPQLLPMNIIFVSWDHFAYILPLFCLYIGIVLPISWVCFAYILGSFCIYLPQISNDVVMF